MTAPNSTIDPFGFWPHYASVIDGLGGNVSPHDPRYAFHTTYVIPAEGGVTFTLEAAGLEARGGTVGVSVLALTEGKLAPKIVETLHIPLVELAANGGRREIAVRSRPGSFYALLGLAADKVDAHAEQLSIRLDRWNDGERYSRRLHRARRSVFGRPSRVGRSWWRSGSPVDLAGLVAAGSATLANPISQMCTDAQFDEPEFERWSTAMGIAPHRHRKLWEFVFILRTLEHRGLIRSGTRGLGFGTGLEPLPSLLAAHGVAVLATDLPPDSQMATGWSATGQHSESLASLYRPDLVDREAFERLVDFRAVDMNAIPDDLAGFDFCWSACAFEHLGSIDAGLQFVRESLRPLKPGGIAVHTTELNLSSDGDTLDNGATVLFRRRDFERLALALTQEGHEVAPLCYDQGDRPLDDFIDLPPYCGDAQLKIALSRYVTTSFGIVVRKRG